MCFNAQSLLGYSSLHKYNAKAWECSLFTKGHPTSRCAGGWTLEHVFFMYKSGKDKTGFDSEFTGPRGCISFSVNLMSIQVFDQLLP